MLVLLFFTLNFAIYFPILDQTEWKKSLDKNGIAIFTRSSESSNFKEFLAKAQFEGSIDEFKTILLDVDSYADWMPDCQSAQIVSSTGLKEVTYHMKIKVPFPFENRDIVQQLILREKGNALEIDILCHPNIIDEEKKYVRMIEGSGKWLIEEVSADEISIRFQYHANPGGDIPAWLVNSFIVKNPHIMLERIREKMANR